MTAFSRPTRLFALGLLASTLVTLGVASGSWLLRATRAVSPTPELAQQVIGQHQLMLRPQSDYTFDTPTGQQCAQLLADGLIDTPAALRCRLAECQALDGTEGFTGLVTHLCALLHQQHDRWSDVTDTLSLLTASTPDGGRDTADTIFERQIIENARNGFQYTIARQAERERELLTDMLTRERIIIQQERLFRGSPDGTIDEFELHHLSQAIDHFRSSLDSSQTICNAQKDSVTCQGL